MIENTKKVGSFMPNFDVKVIRLVFECFVTVAINL